MEQNIEKYVKRTLELPHRASDFFLLLCVPLQNLRALISLIRSVCDVHARAHPYRALTRIIIRPCLYAVCVRL